MQIPPELLATPTPGPRTPPPGAGGDLFATLLDAEGGEDTPLEVVDHAAQEAPGEGGDQGFAFWSLASPVPGQAATVAAEGGGASPVQLPGSEQGRGNGWGAAPAAVPSEDAAKAPGAPPPPQGVAGEGTAVPLRGMQPVAVAGPAVPAGMREGAPDPDAAPVTRAAPVPEPMTPAAPPPAAAVHIAPLAPPPRAMAEAPSRAAPRTGGEQAAAPAVPILAPATEVAPIQSAPSFVPVPAGTAPVLMEVSAPPLAGVEGTLAPVRSEATAPAPAMPAPAPAPPPVAGQLALAARSLPDGPVEIALAPAELGRVTLTLAASDTAITVSLLAERAETLDLLRRSIGQLAEELRALGYDNPSFSFGGDPGARDRGPRAERAAGFAVIDAVPVPAAGPRAVQGLDLRL